MKTWCARRIPFQNCSRLVLQRRQIYMHRLKMRNSPSSWRVWNRSSRLGRMKIDSAVFSNCFDRTLVTGVEGWTSSILGKSLRPKQTKTKIDHLFRCHRHSTDQQQKSSNWHNWTIHGWSSGKVLRWYFVSLSRWRPYWFVIGVWQPWSDSDSQERRIVSDWLKRGE